MDCNFSKSMLRNEEVWLSQVQYQQGICMRTNEQQNSCNEDILDFMHVQYIMIRREKTKLTLRELEKYMVVFGQQSTLPHRNAKQGVKRKETGRLFLLLQLQINLNALILEIFAN